jgi:hypothetical protein
VTGHGEKFTRKKELAIAALLQFPTLPEAAIACKLSERTLRRWLSNAEFQEQYRAERTRVLEGTVNTLRKKSLDAADMLVQLMTHEGEIEQRSARVSAARSIISLAIAGAEMLDLEERLAELEELAARER